MKYDWFAERISYSIVISSGQLQLICDHEDRWDNDINRRGSLAGLIDKIEGLSNTDYDGHLGPYIYLRIDFVDDTDQTKAKITQLINDFTVYAVLTLIFPPSDEEDE